VQDKWWGGRKHGAGCDCWSTRRVTNKEPVFRWERGIEHCGDEHGENGALEPDLERDWLWDKQVLYLSVGMN
jgi:hypothetical protein